MHILLAPSLVLGCAPGEDALLETEDLRFHGELDGACSALGRLYERELSRVELALGHPLLEPVDVHVGRAAVDQRCAAGDGEPLAGCTPSPTEIATTLPALSHELVHAIRMQHGIVGIPFVEEGVATMVGTGRPGVPLAVVIDPSDPDRQVIPQLSYGWSELPAVDRSLGAHFLGWVGEDYGTDALQALLWSAGVRHGDAVPAAFAEATGEALARAQARWHEEAEPLARFSDLCAGRPAPGLPAEGLRIEASACCDDPDVEQAEPPLLRMGHRCLMLPAGATVDVELLAGDGELVVRPDGCEGDPVIVASGQATTLVTTGACRWQAMVVGPERCDARDEEAGVVRYSITPR